MPSVRVRQNTAPVAAANTPGRPRGQLFTATRVSSNQESTNEQDSQGRAQSVKSSDTKGDTRQEIVLGPPVALDRAGAAQGQLQTPSTNNGPGDENPLRRETAPVSTGRRGSETAEPSTRRRPRSRTIQAIFPRMEELVHGPGMAELTEEPEPISPTAGRGARVSTDSRLSSDERTRRAEAIARVRGGSITTTSGAAPVAIRLPGSDQSQVAEAVNPVSFVEAAEGKRRRSASITLGLAAKTRRSNERARFSGDRSRSESVSSGAGAGARARARTVGAASAGRGRADSVGLMSYFGIGNGIEAKLQSREEERRDLEKGMRGSGEYARGENELSTMEEAEEEGEHHEDEVVEHLDVIDPEIAAVSHLQNFANSVVIPYLPQLYSRRPVLDLPSTAPQADTELSGGLRSRKGTVSTKPNQVSEAKSSSDKAATKTEDQTSTGDESTEEEDPLDQHVKDVLKKSKKEWLKRSLKGVWAFLKTPMGIIVGIYGFLVVFWGAALVIFLAGWIPLSSSNLKDIWVERCSQIVNGLFTVTGVGLIPWRVMDAYRILRIWQLKRLSIKLRKKRGLPPIQDPDDLPDPKLDPDFVPVLSEYQQALLEYQQERFMASQTWYRPHATETHRAFSINWALWICLLVVGNSAFQCMLCGCMWGLNRHQRPAWTTGSLIPLSFGCGIASGILIWKGGQKTKKTAQVEHKLRKALGMGSHEDSIEEKERLLSTSSPRTENRNSGESYNSGPVAMNVGSSGDEDPQRKLSDREDSGTAAAADNPRAKTVGNNGDEYEMRETRRLGSSTMIAS